jgi:NTP pyrophosphatase (non-canonical NTP hydrolase)
MIDFDIYQLRAMRTAKPMEPQDDLMHAAYGVAGEAGEFADCVKKNQVYGRELDRENAIEELGDLLWYVALGCRALNATMSEVAQQNLEKLKARYPEKYTDELAAERKDKAV